MKRRNPNNRDNLHIKKQDRVVEIGSGHNPMFRSNVIVEKFVDNNYHRGGDIYIYPHQHFVNADGENLPFKDKEFDYAICNQVLEHVEHPEAFIREISRIAKRGYIETPSLIGEHLFPKKSHKWVILDIDGKLVMYEKKLLKENYENDYGRLFLNYLPYQSLVFKLLELTEKKLLNNCYEWEDDIEILVNPTDSYYRSFFTMPWTDEMIKKIFPPRSLRTELQQTIKALFFIVKCKIKRVRKKRPISLTEYLKRHRDQYPDLYKLHESFSTDNQE
ncbi:class I SAM-dependent methyltransferase [Bacteroides heparinolyticus]|uniref:class I SAM-dependent methyltransferase n=1 Tax=Prevotella heparinolytica TaxID=28113 RepID=UPI00359F3F4E